MFGAWSGGAFGSLLAAALGWPGVAGLTWLDRAGRDERTLARFVGAAGLLGAVALTALRNIHGPPVLAGAALMVGLLWHTGLSDE